MTTSQPQYSLPAAAAVSGWLADTEGAQAEADEQLPVFPDEQFPDEPRHTDSDGEPVGSSDVAEDIRRAGGDPEDA